MQPPTTFAAEQAHMQAIAAALNKILDHDLTQGRVIVMRDQGGFPFVSVTISDPAAHTAHTAVYTTAKVGIKGAGLFREVFASADWHPQTESTIHKGETWPLSALGASTTHTMIAESVVRLLANAALRAVKHHQHSSIAFAALTSPTRK